MKNRVFILSLFLLGLFLAGCSEGEGPLPADVAPLSVEDQSALKAAKKHTVPFKSSFEMWGVDFYLDQGGEFFHQELAGEGNATHMGKTKVVILDELLYPDDPDDPDNYFNPGYPWTATADVILTAANGDELRFNYASSFMMGYPIDVVGHGLITGGTGRFSDASGEMTYKGHWPSATENGKVTFTGKIKY